MFAASSLQPALEEIAERWQSKGNDAPTFSFASSTALARQIENGSFADLYVSADTQWTDYIVSAGRIDAAQIRTLAANEVVAATHRDSPYAVDYVETPPAKVLFAGKSLVTGDPDSVPLGRYAKQILESEGAWDEIAPRLIRTPSSSAALRMVLLKEADFGLLYASDAVRRDDLVSYNAFDTDAYSPIIYKAVRLPSSGHPDADAFLDYLVSEEAAEILSKYGFKTP